MFLVSFREENWFQESNDVDNVGLTKAPWHTLLYCFGVVVYASGYFFWSQRHIHMLSWADKKLEAYGASHPHNDYFGVLLFSVTDGFR